VNIQAGTTRPRRQRWRRCRALSGRPRHVPRNLFLAALYLGGLGGAFLGAAGGVLMLAAILASYLGSAYGAVLGLFALITALVTGTVAVVLVGALDGLVMTLVVHVCARPGKGGLGSQHVALAACVTTLAGGTAVLEVVTRGMNGAFIYVPAAAAALLAWPMSRRLPITRYRDSGEHGHTAIGP
jgi:hypothetical protein